MTTCGIVAVGEVEILVGGLSAGLGARSLPVSMLLNRESQYKSTSLTLTSLYHHSSAH
jgi:hypothetical protein